MDRQTGAVTSKTLANPPPGWTKHSTNTQSKWRWNLPPTEHTQHPCRCTGDETNFEQGSGLPWTTGLGKDSVRSLVNATGQYVATVGSKGGVQLTPQNWKQQRGYQTWALVGKSAAVPYLDVSAPANMTKFSQANMGPAQDRAYTSELLQSYSLESFFITTTNALGIPTTGAGVANNPSPTGTPDVANGFLQPQYQWGERNDTCHAWIC